MKRKILCLCLGVTLIFGNAFSVNAMETSEMVCETIHEKAESVQTADTEDMTSVFETEVAEEAVDETETAAETETVEEMEIAEETETVEETVIETQGILEASEAAGERLSPVSNLKAVSAGKNRVKLSWDKVEGAEAYIIYRQVGNGKYSYLYITSNLTYVDMKASGLDYNFYWVFPSRTNSDGKRIVGPCSKYVFAKAVLSAAASVKAQPAGINRTKLTWNGVSGADGYIIYRQVGKGDYQYRGMTSNLFYTDTTASDTEFNFYWVYPYYKQDGANVATTSGKYVFAKGVLPAVSGLKAQVIGKRIKLTWNAVNGAEGYLIYRQEGNGTFKYLYMTNNLSYIDSKCNGSEYNFYRVYAYHKNGERIIPGAVGKYVFGTLVLDPVKQVKAEATGTREITVTWDRARGADGYYVLRQWDSQTEAEIIGEVNNGNTLKYVDKSPSVDETNYYAIIPYLVDGQGNTVVVDIITAAEANAIAVPVEAVQISGYESYSNAYKVLQLVNQERAAQSLPPLTMDESLVESAMQRAAEIVVLFDHMRPCGLACFSINSRAWGENIAYGYNSAESVMKGWMNSPGHRSNILGNYSTIGIGCFEYNGVDYWVQLFGVDDVESARQLPDRNYTRTVLVKSGVNTASAYALSGSEDGISTERDMKSVREKMNQFVQRHEF